ncbi:MAG: hypothetical protein A3H49_10700 [Nitrospirae bacterium RIFCSPLOWO2_02_FULL_62_14]|nr:MAG: hypothetical protein A3H49_10700 [Nitrospirae bacterium RIFCSPLOWO2_02_FULL_62_14]
METLDEVRQTITIQLTTDDSDTRSQYLNHFGHQVAEFSDAMSRAFLEWRALDGQLGKDERKAYVSALIYCAVALHILSMKLFLSGHTVPAGNLYRQVAETIALACLCSAKNLDILDRFMQDKYSTNDALRDAVRHAKRLQLNADAIEVLRRTRDFYHEFSHPSQLMIATHMSFSDGNVVLGASFDSGKLEEYRKEVASRVNLAKVFGNLVSGIRSNISRWKE